MRQSLQEQVLFNAVSQIMEKGEKRTVQDIAEALDALGLLEVDVDAMKMEKARDAIAMHRKRCVKAKDVQREIVNLVDCIEGEDGTSTKVPYYKIFHALTTAEAAQLLEIEHAKLKGQSKKFFRYYNPLRKRHGVKLQRMLQFEIPAKMRDQAEAIN